MGSHDSSNSTGVCVLFPSNLDCDIEDTMTDSKGKIIIIKASLTGFIFTLSQSNMGEILDTCPSMNNKDTNMSQWDLTSNTTFTSVVSKQTSITALRQQCWLRGHLVANACVSYYYGLYSDPYTQVKRSQNTISEMIELLSCRWGMSSQPGGPTC